jgi:predicted small secreted protein
MRNLMIGALACLALAACETVQGAGRDIQKAGQTIESAAN